MHGAPKIGVGGTQSGPQIREANGELVWYGGGVDAFGARGEDVNVKGPERQRVQDFHVCDYRGEKDVHLCWSEKNEGQGRKKIVLDASYNLVEVFKSGLVYDGGIERSNMHEFNMVDDGENYLQPAWPQRVADLTVIGGPEDGRIWDGCFQDVVVSTGEPEFEWCWMDHFPIWETNIFPTDAKNITGNITSIKVGSGTKESPYDAWHVNSMDKNFEGDYLLSTRHDDQILKIAGKHNVHGVKPGTALWRVGGRGADIKMEGEDFVFTKQHGVRYVSTTADETIFSILDNAWEGALQPSANASSGMIISVNNATNTARLLHRYYNPRGIVAPSQGSFQLLPNKNAFVAWGSRSQFSEFTEDGELLFHAAYTNETTDSEEYYTYSYRIWKFPWIGKPSWTPKLISYSHNCNNTTPLIAWVSWNGATEVRTWRFSVSNYPTGPWWAAGTFPRTGFETTADLSQGTLSSTLKHITFPRYVLVEGLDANDDVLPNGEQIAETFVPQPNIREKFCDADGCFGKENFEYDPKLSCAVTCGRSLLPQFIVLIFLFVVLEMGDSAYQRLCAQWTKAGWRYGGDAEYAAVLGSELGLKPSKSPMPENGRFGNPVGMTNMAEFHDESLTVRPGYTRHETAE